MQPLLCCPFAPRTSFANSFRRTGSQRNSANTICLGLRPFVPRKPRNILLKADRSGVERIPERMDESRPRGASRVTVTDTAGLRAGAGGAIRSGPDGWSGRRSVNGGGPAPHISGVVLWLLVRLSDSGTSAQRSQRQARVRGCQTTTASARRGRERRVRALHVPGVADLDLRRYARATCSTFRRVMSNGGFTFLEASSHGRHPSECPWVALRSNRLVLQNQHDLRRGWIILDATFPLFVLNLNMG